VLHHVLLTLGYALRFPFSIYYEARTLHFRWRIRVRQVSDTDTRTTTLVGHVLVKYPIQKTIF